MPILQEHKDILFAESGNRTLMQWYDFFNQQYSKKTIYSFCYHNQLKIKKASLEENSQNGRKYHINQDYFKTWSSNMAYTLGLWCAKGCIYREKIFDITLHAKDKYILKRVAEELGYEGVLYDYVDRQVARLNFSCVVIYKDIEALGGMEQFPDVPQEYLPDFIRGYFDGVGCIMVLKGDRLNSAFTSDNKAFLDQLLVILKDQAGVIGGSYDINSMSLRLGKRDTIALGRYMYKNNPELFLKRKKDKFIL